MMMMMMPMMPLAIGDRKDDRFFHAPPPRSFMHSPEKERKERERERERAFLLLLLLLLLRRRRLEEEEHLLSAKEMTTLMKNVYTQRERRLFLDQFLPKYNTLN